MKAKAKERFTDLKEKKIREIDDVFEVTKDRLNELQKLGIKVEEIKEKKTPKKKGD